MSGSASSLRHVSMFVFSAHVLLEAIFLARWHHSCGDLSVDSFTRRERLWWLEVLPCDA